jgi:hypothetical protein
VKIQSFWFLCGYGRKKRGPCVHKRPSLFERITAPVSPFGLVAGHVGERRLGNLAREIRLFATPIPKARPEAVYRCAFEQPTAPQALDEAIKRGRRILPRFKVVQRLSPSLHIQARTRAPRSPLRPLQPLGVAQCCASLTPVIHYMPGTMSSKF